MNCFSLLHALRISCCTWALFQGKQKSMHISPLHSVLCYLWLCKHNLVLHTFLIQVPYYLLKWHNLSWMSNYHSTLQYFTDCWSLVGQVSVSYNPWSSVSDQVAVPDYPSGATEHWGLITYRESRLLYNENEAGASDKQSTAQIVAHELAHNV